MWRDDGWDARWRIGLLTPAAAIGSESELNAMAPPGTVIHAARIPFGAMTVDGVMDPTIPHGPVRAFAESSHIDAAAKILAGLRVQAIAFGFTSSAYVLGITGESAMIDRLRALAGGLPVVTPTAAAVTALRGFGVQQIALVDPPWFDRELSKLGSDYFRAAGFNVVFAAPAMLPSAQRSITRPAVFDWVRRNVARSAEAVVISGNGFRAVGVIDALEAELEMPVLSANQVLLWSALVAVGAESATVEGYGQLFRS